MSLQQYPGRATAFLSRRSRYEIIIELEGVKYRCTAPSHAGFHCVRARHNIAPAPGGGITATDWAQVLRGQAQALREPDAFYRPPAVLTE